MALPYLTRRSFTALIGSLSVLAGLAAALPAGAEARLAELKPSAAQAGRFTLFESGQVRPLALSPSGNAKRASLAASVMSQATASAAPKPSASPCTRATTGTGTSQIA